MKYIFECIYVCEGCKRISERASTKTKRVQISEQSDSNCGRFGFNKKNNPLF